MAHTAGRVKASPDVSAKPEREVDVQHFNDDPVNQCRLVRVHMFDSILETMRALVDPMVLFEEAEDTLLSTQELSQIRWPQDRRPEG